MTENAKCANCGKDLEVASSPNFKMYCTESACNDAFMAEVMNKNKKKK